MKKKIKDSNSRRLSNITKVNHVLFLKDRSLQNEIKMKIKNGHMIVFKKFVDKKIINKLKKYLVNIGKNSLPGFEPISNHAKNHHRVVNNDPRSFVKGCFHQFSFFPWNQDPFSIFNEFKEGYWIKNILSNNAKDTFLKINSKNEIVARLSFQFYPKGQGYLNLHSDPIGNHQITAPILVMSSKGKNKDFNKGGSYLLNKKNKKIYIEDKADIGDLIMYDASIPHGVDYIDGKNLKKNSWINFEGRWMLL